MPHWPGAYWITIDVPSLANIRGRSLRKEPPSSNAIRQIPTFPARDRGAKIAMRDDALFGVFSFWLGGANPNLRMHSTPIKPK